MSVQARMTRAHFVLIAETIRDLDVPPTVRTILADRFARNLAATNGRFDSGRFVRVATEVRPCAR